MKECDVWRSHMVTESLAWRQASEWVKTETYDWRSRRAPHQWVIQILARFAPNIIYLHLYDIYHYFTNSLYIISDIPFLPDMPATCSYIHQPAARKIIICQLVNLSASCLYQSTIKSTSWQHIIYQLIDLYKLLLWSHKAPPLQKFLLMSLFYQTIVNPPFPHSFIRSFVRSFKRG